MLPVFITEYFGISTLASHFILGTILRDNESWTSLIANPVTSRFEQLQSIPNEEDFSIYTYKLYSIL